ncbi:UDP-glucose flavonoid 3-O-glucosyltransferase 7-like [Pistacia vera]|uniref:UDP-glucose flavonoid 3-O-glucosyltransferase 7-like n=1 Tax=Pistacia vera TaxID=55513 RepID=UPI001262FA84|nr:UDP-glucose flavonoid 3-O-glucosyltransferase 7-like [Pistacia vera]
MGLDGLGGNGGGEEEEGEGEGGEGKNGKKDLFVYRKNFEGIEENLEAKQEGPAFLYDEINGNRSKSLSFIDYLDWPDDRVTKPASVIYISFGPQAHLCNADIDEIGYGLELSGHDFLWVVKSKTWRLPNGLEEKVKGNGLIVKDWAEQRQVLAHPAVGDFLSHCGWN